MNRARGVLLKGVSDVIVRAGGLITFPMVIRYTGADGYGAFSQVMTIVSFLVPFASLGLTNSLVRFFSVREWNGQTRAQFLQVAALVLLSTTVMGSSFLFFAPMLSRLFLDWPDGARLFAWGGLLLVVSALEQLLLGFFRSRQWFTQSSLLEIIQAVISISCTLILLPRNWGVVGLFMAMLFVKLGVYVLFYSGFWFWNSPEPGRDGESLRLRPMIAFGISGIISSLGLWMMNLGDRLVIGHFLSADALGFYGATYNLAFILMAVNAPFLLPVYPRLVVALAKDSTEEAGREARYFHRFVSLALIPSTLFMIIMVKPALFFLGGKGFEVDGLMAAMIILSVAMDQYNAIPHYVLYSKDQMKFSQNAWVAAGILNLLMNWFLVPRFGLRGAAFATLITFVLLEWAVIARASRFLPILSMYRFDVTAKALVAGGTASIATYLFFNRVLPSKEGLLVSAFLFSAVYASGILLMKEVTKSDFDLLRRAVFGRSLKPG